MKTKIMQREAKKLINRLIRKLSIIESMMNADNGYVMIDGLGMLKEANKTLDHWTP